MNQILKLTKREGTYTENTFQKRTIGAKKKKRKKTINSILKKEKKFSCTWKH